MQDPRKLLKRIGSPRVLVVGDVMLDRYTWGNAERVSPEAPVLVLRADLDEIRPGGAASVAYLLRGLDAQVTIAGLVGQDAEGRTLRRLLDEAGIDHSLLFIDDARVTTSKERIVGRASNCHAHQLVRVDREHDRPIDRQLENHMLSAIIEQLPEHDALLICDYGKGLCSQRFLASVIEAAVDFEVPTLVDPARGADCGFYQEATLLKPNRSEAEVASGVPISVPADALTAGRLLCQQSRVEAVLITLDADGMALAPAGGKGKLISTRRRNVHDVTGAGDMALAVLGLCAAAEIGWPEAAFLANVAAGLEVEQFGVSIVTRDEICRELASDRPFSAGKIVLLQELLADLEKHRRSDRRIVFTNGCFDLLHVGHVRCLQEAAALGDVLIVAINSDASVRRLKGSGRPIVKQQDRAAMLAALGCVDYVMIFGADAPHQLLEVIQPDVLAKGGSCPSDAVAGREIVAAYGGQIRLTGLVRDISTTRILESIEHRSQLS